MLYGSKAAIIDPVKQNKGMAPGKQLNFLKTSKT